MGRLSKPVVPDGPRRVLRDRLHALHAEAGWPSLRELQRRTRGPDRPHGINPTTIHDAFSSPRLPRWEVLEAIVGQLGGRPADFTALWRAARVAAVEAAPDPVSAPAVPAPMAAEPSMERVPAQLPPDLPVFSGREAELRRLDTLLAGGAGEPRVVAIDGTAGVGKTALAVHVAHRVRDRFPDGQVYLNLRGFDPTDPATTPADAIRAILDAFGVPARQIPDPLDAQIGLCRTVLAGRRALLVLDNARDPDQVRPLLPAAPGCLVLVTSRNRLTGLVATAGAYPLTLDVLGAADARTLLESRIGADRAATAPAAVDRIAVACARLPLALAVAAARAAALGFGLTALADELDEARGDLDVFATADLSTDVRSVFSWSYRLLSEPAARLFRLLATHPGPTVTVAAAASLAGATVRDARRLLGELTAVHLAGEPVPGRYACHDLLRAYAAEVAGTPDGTALRRVLDHYLHSTYVAVLQIEPHRARIDLAPPLPGVTVAPPDTVDSAAAWFAAEHPVLLAAVRQSAAAGLDPYTWRLAWTLVPFLDRQGRWSDLVASQRAAVAATMRLGDRRAEARAHRSVAYGSTRLGRYDDARDHLQQAITLYADLGDHSGLANAHRDLGWINGLEDRNAEALHHARRALELFRTAGDEAGQARALNAVGWYLSRLGELPDALDHCQRALDLHQRLGNRPEQAHTWDSLGHIRHRLGQFGPAVAAYRQALRLHRAGDNRRHEAETLDQLGAVHQAAGDATAARRAWRRALDVLDRSPLPDTEELRAALTGRVQGLPDANAHSSKSVA